MTEEDNYVEVRRQHDRKGIEVLLADDFAELDLDKAKDLQKRLEKTIEAAEKNEPEAPAPLELPAEFADGFNATGIKVMAETMPRQKEEPEKGIIVVLGHELDVREADSLRNWLENAVKYHKQGSAGDTPKTYVNGKKV